MVGMFTSLYSDGLRRVQSARTREAFSTTILWVQTHSLLAAPSAVQCFVSINNGMDLGLNENWETFNLRSLESFYTKFTELPRTWQKGFEFQTED